MRRILGLSLEDESDDPTDVGDASEFDIERDSTDVDAQIEDDQNLNVVLESLTQYAVCIESLIDRQTCTPETLQVLRLGVEVQMNRLHEEMNVRALESADGDIERQHRIVLEGIRDVLNRYFQGVVVAWKHFFNAIGDFVRTTNGQIKKYRNKLNDTEGEFKRASSDWDETSHTGSIVQLWYHFMTDKGQVANIGQAVAHDLTLSKYILRDYSGEIIKQVGKTTSVIKSAKANSISDVKKFFTAMEGLKSGGDLFEQRYVGGHPFLSVTGLVMKVGDRRNPTVIDDKVFDKLAKLATPECAVEVGKYSHIGKKVASQVVPYAPLADMVLAKTITMSSSDIGQLIKSGHAYLDHVEAYLSSCGHFISEMNKATDALLSLTNKSTGDFSGSEMAHVLKGFRHVEQYIANLLQCYQKPGKSEVARSIKGAKYCMYLANRMMYNAK